MRPRLRRLLWGAIAAVVLLGTAASIEVYTADARASEFFHRTGGIHNGMSETEATATAGEPDKFVTELGTGQQPVSAEGACREVKATAAMLYSFEMRGWIGEYLGLSSSISTQVVCLDARRTVVKTYLHMIQF